MTLSIIMTTLRSSPRSSVTLLASGVATAVSAVVALQLSISSFSTSLDDTTDHDDAHQPQHDSIQQTPFITIEPDFIDRIRCKSYMKDTQRGIPNSLRIMTVDVPEFRHHLLHRHNTGGKTSSSCAVNYRASFADGIAPERHLPDGRRVEQKMLAQSVYQCKTSRAVVGIEVLEISVRNLNPNNVRRNAPVMNAVEKIKQSIEERTSKDDSTNKTRQKKKEESKAQQPVLATDEDELIAPWNQYAWRDELVLRVSRNGQVDVFLLSENHEPPSFVVVVLLLLQLEGRVQYGAMMEKSTWLSRLAGDQVYRPSIHHSKRWYEHLLPLILCSDPAGVDGVEGTWASNMPHAVVANGLALNQVPGSLLLLKKTCDDLEIPLYVIHDPRRWVSTNKDLNEAIRDLRQTVKANIIHSATKGSGSAFSRGYYLGKVEAETKQQIKEQYETITANFTAVHQELDHDWSRLSAKELEDKLADHKAIIQVNGKTKMYTQGLLDLATKLLLLDRETHHHPSQKMLDTPQMGQKSIPEPPVDDGR